MAYFLNDSEASISSSPQILETGVATGTLLLSEIFAPIAYTFSNMHFELPLTKTAILLYSRSGSVSFTVAI